MMMTYEELRKT